MTSSITRAIVATAAAASLCVAPTLATTAQAAPAVAVVAHQGTSGATVRTIQNDLRYLGYFTARVNGSYGPATTSAVKAFQHAYKLPVTGTMDATSFRVLRTKSDARRAADKAAAAQRAAAAKAAAAKRQAALQQVVAKPGDRTAAVRTLQSNLAKLGYLPSSSVIGVYGPATTAAVKKVQASYRSPETGVVTRELFNLIAQRAAAVKKTTTTTQAAHLDPRCYVGRTICVDKSHLRMYWVVNGKVLDDWSVRVGRPSLPTREGTFHIYLKSTNWWSTLYHVNMPYSQFFSGGEAVHYSVDFATHGYYGGGSHGCVNMRDLAGAKWLYSQTRVGDRVVVYH